MNTIYASLDDIVFENKDKNYGAYHLRRKYNRYLSRAALITLLLFLSGTAMPKMISWFKDLPERVEIEEPIIVCGGIIDTLPTYYDVKIKPILPPVVEPPQIKTVEFVAFIPVKDASEELTIKKIDDLEGLEIGDKDQDGDENGKINWDAFESGDGNGVGELPKEEKEPDPDEWIDLQYEPKAVNMEAFKKSVGYPDLAYQAGMEGKVVLKVLVDKRGNYEKHIVLQDPHELLTKAVISKVSQLKFTPGIQAGRPVKVWVTIPVNFEIKP
jgi:periplasmic protein TonB